MAVERSRSCRWRTLNLRTVLVLVLVCGTSLYALQTWQRDPRLSEILARLQAARDPMARREALFDLELWSSNQPIVSERALALMQAASRDPEPSVRAQALSSLSSEGRRLMRAARRTLAPTASGKPTPQAVAVIPAAVEMVLERALDDPAPAVHVAAAMELGLFGVERARAGIPWSATGLPRLLADPAPAVRVDVLKIFARLPLMSDAELPDEVVQALADPEPDVQYAALQALRAWVQRDPGAVAASATRLTGPDLTVRRALKLPGDGTLPPVVVANLHSRLVDPVLPLLEDADPDLRREAARLLGDLGPLARPAIPALIRAYTRWATGPDPLDWPLVFLESLARIDPGDRSVVQIREPLIARFEREVNAPLAVEPVADENRIRPEKLRLLQLLWILGEFGPWSVAALPPAQRLARESPDPDLQQEARLLIRRIVVEPFDLSGP